MGSQRMSREEEENILPEEGSVPPSRLLDCYEYHRKSSVKSKLCTVLTFTGIVAGVSLLITFTVIRSLEILKWSNLSKTKSRLSLRNYPSHEEIDKIIETIPSMYPKNISVNISTVGYSVENIAIKEISLFNTEKLGEENN